MIQAIAFTVYPVKDVARSRRFYEETLRLKAESSGCEGRWVEYEVGGATFAITDLNDRAVAGAGGAVAFEVDDLDRTLESFNAGAIVEPAFDTPVCRMAIVADPDGNELILHKKSVKK